MNAVSESLLSIEALHAHYGKSHILHGVSFQVVRNEVISLLGRNGSGRSTTMKSIMGLVRPSSGHIRLQGRELAGARPYAICRAGIAYVPEEREVFANLTVDENLRMGEQPAVTGAYQWTVEKMFDYFPRLKERRNTKAGSMSGGEQQMLTICRSLLGNPLVILIDEPTEGLAPKIVTQVGECIKDMREKGVSVVLVEQKLAIALKVSTRVCVMGHGNIVFEGTPEELASDKQLLTEWLAV
ncbi:ABC transporter ATP-binding protein [Noviherbaspirillum sedimenti]|uniref:ABC transporter ATP-binding protein n=1 Tax=Noviherbaspirillum sedimenti TaxID=2320865 RepID=A0A3A3G657_9BURK|nr:ABC transporter ATP-binding protein [Noviherbaspirillum sedimenti]RJG03928.1 ABC transporter ATP-binding protein [Noviherbaspirillum sedimenti]